MSPCLGCAQQSCGGCPAAATAGNAVMRRRAAAMQPGLGFTVPDAPISTWPAALGDWKTWALAAVAAYFLYRLFSGAASATKARKKRRYSAEALRAKRDYDQRMAKIQERYA